MKTWRERIAEARVRGGFNRGDITAWENPNTCLVGEQRRKYDLLFNLEMTGIGIPQLGKGDRGLQLRILQSLERDEFDTTEQLLDQVEDLALQLKREHV